MRAPPAVGLRANLAQFSLLVGVNALVGGMVGQERAVLPLLADEVFGVRAFSAALSFVVVFGLVKAAANLLAGVLADRWGRKPVLVLGWLAGLPVPLMVMWAPSWSWIVVANALLGLNQGLAWSATLMMKIDLAGPERRGLAMGLNESAGYLSVAGTALATGVIASRMGLRPAPFLLGLAYAGLGLTVSIFAVKETASHARRAATEAARRTTPRPSASGDGYGLGQVFLVTTVRNRALSAVTQAGLVNNLNDGVAWGLFPLLFADAGLSAAAVGTLAAIYPAVWGMGQLAAGPLSDRWGRKWLIAAGMWTQAGAILAIATASGFASWAAATALLGVGTAMVYPTLLAAVCDVAHPRWRASAVGVYRLWRDVGFAVGALLAGVVADVWGVRAAVAWVGVLTAASGGMVARRMYETRPHATDRLPEPYVLH